MANTPKTVVALARTRDGRAAKLMLRIVDPQQPDLTDAKDNVAEAFRFCYGETPPRPTVWIEEDRAREQAPAPAPAAS